METTKELLLQKKIKESIKENGLLEPLLVRLKENGRYELISGHRRKKAYEILGLNEIDVIVEMMITPIKNGDYAGAFDNFINECESSLKTGISLFWIPGSIVLGFALAFLIVKIQASKLKTVRQQADASDYVGNVVLTG